MRNNIWLVVIITILSVTNLISQGRVTGNFVMEGQYYQQDSSIGTTEFPKEVAAQGYLNVRYHIEDFEFGIRYEAYRPPLLGIDSRFENSGFPFIYGTYRSSELDVTAGNFYEQFGSGLILRTYEEKALGVDNSLNGVRVNLRPDDGVELTALMGTMRNFWTQSDGIIRGAKGKVYLDQYTDFFGNNGVSLEGGIISKYEEDQENTYNLPENVFAYYLRSSFMADEFSLDAEYSYKINDPSAVNNFSYNVGQGLLLSGSYFTDGLGISLDFHRSDNMDFRAERSATGNVMNMNFIPPLSKQHTYRLTSLYPYATQLVGEIGLQADVTYKFAPETTLGGEYGTTVSVNYSRIHGIDSNKVNDFTYTSDFFAFGDRLFYQDLNFEISKRWSEDLKTNVSFLSQIYDKDVAENGWAPIIGKVKSNIAILDITYRLSEDYALKMDLEHLWATQDSVLKTADFVNGNWIMALFELTISPHYYISFSDEFNYGNKFEDHQVHYYMGSFAYVTGGTRMQMSYGRQRSGIICVGGVCRFVPASNGLYFTVSTTF
ncbi:MAG: hypothetical protein KDC55_01890 [Ignavibacteriae bacterium]|nr:hypothetical protein [Ignavibacteriota bacterium]